MCSPSSTQPFIVNESFLQCMNAQFALCPQYALQLQAKLVNRKNKTKQDVNRNFEQHDQELTASAAQEEEVCIKVRFISYIFYWIVNVLNIESQWYWLFFCWCFNAPPVLHILGNQTTFCILALTRTFLCFCFIRLDYKRLLHMDAGMPDSDQYWHKGSLRWGSYCCCSAVLTCLMGE